MGQEITSIEVAHDWLSRQTSHQLRPGFDRMRHALSLLGSHKRLYQALFN